jgi:hypothetical protein
MEAATVAGTSQRSHTPADQAVTTNPYDKLADVLRRLRKLSMNARRDNTSYFGKIKQFTRDWDAADALARNMSAARGIPFAAFDPAISDAKTLVIELAQVAAGDATVPFDPLDTEYAKAERRLEELGETYAGATGRAVVSSPSQASSAPKAPPPTERTVMDALAGLIHRVKCYLSENPDGKPEPQGDTSPMYLIQQAMEHLLATLMPSGVHRELRCEDIDASNLDPAVKTQLRDLRTSLQRGPMWPFTIQNDPHGAIDELHEALRGVFISWLRKTIDHLEMRARDASMANSDYVEVWDEAHGFATEHLAPEEMDALGSRPPAYSGTEPNWPAILSLKEFYQRMTGQPTATAGGSFAEVLAFAENELKGDEQTAIKLVCQGHPASKLPPGKFPIKELALKFSWSRDKTSNRWPGFDNLVRRLKPKLAQLAPPYRLHRQDNNATLEVIAP